MSIDLFLFALFFIVPTLNRLVWKLSGDVLEILPWVEAGGAGTPKLVVSRVLWDIREGTDNLSNSVSDVDVETLHELLQEYSDILECIALVSIWASFSMTPVPGTRYTVVNHNSVPLRSASCVPGVISSALPLSSHLNLTIEDRSVGVINPVST